MSLRMAVLVLTAVALPLAARAADDRTEVWFALLRYEGGQFNPRPRGLPRLAWEVRRRTSIASTRSSAS